MATLVKQGGGGFLWVAVVLLAGWEGSSDQRDGTKWWVGWIGRVGDGVWGRGGGSSLFLFGAFPDAEVRL